MNDSTLPACIGYYPKAIEPNRCDTCKHRELCKKTIAKSRLQPILEKIREIENVLKGEEKT